MSLLFLPVSAQDPALNGVWQHADKPAVIDFSLTDGTATVKIHDNNKGSEGLNLIRNIKQTSDDNIWQGEMYDGYKNKYVDVVISMQNASTVTISDTSGKEVLRLIKQPSN